MDASFGPLVATVFGLRRPSDVCEITSFIAVMDANRLETIK
jgi:hypothetical protein